MDIWVWTVIAVLLTALSHVSGADNIAERSFVTSNAQDGNLYSTRYDLIDEYGSSSLNKLTETSPFHEVYSIKGKDGEIQRIHYATDNKGLRANFHSISENLPSSFISAFQPSPFMWPAVANPEKKPFVDSDDSMSIPPLGYVSNNPSQNQIGDKFQIPSGLLDSMGINVNNADKLPESLKSIQFDIESLMTPISQAPVMQNNFQVYPVFPAVSDNEKDTNMASSQVDAEFPYQAEISQSPNGFKQVDNVPEALYGNIGGDLLRIPKPTDFASNKIEKENSPPEAAIQVRENSFSATNRQVPMLPPTLSDVPSTMKQPINLLHRKQSVIVPKKYNQPLPPKESKSTLSSTKSKLLSLNEKNQRKMTKVESNKQKTQKVEKKIKPTLGLEMKDLSVLSSPVSTVFDISTDNGRYYHYVLNRVKPEMKNAIIMESKYFSTGNALLKLLNETGVSYKLDDFQLLSNEQSQKFHPSLDIVYGENRDIPVNISGLQNEVNSADKVSDIKPIEEPQSSANNTHILEKVEENLQTTIAQEELTTEHSTYIPFSTTTEISTSNDLEVTSRSPISEIAENNETETTTIAVNPTKIPVKKNSTEEVEAGSLYITVPKLLAPLNWLFNPSSIANKSEIETNISSSSLNDITTTVFKELEESPTVSLEEHAGTVVSEASDNKTAITTTFAVPTTKPYTTILFDTTTVSEKTITSIKTESVTSVETTTLNTADALDMTSTVAAELPNNETKNFVTENPNAVSEIENNTEASSMITVVSSVSNDGIPPKAENPMVTIQVNDLNELMSRLQKISVELATSASKNRSVVFTDKPKYEMKKKRKEKHEHRDKTNKINLSPADNSPAINTSPILSDLNLFSLMESEESFSKQLPKFKTSVTATDHQEEEVEAPIVKYSLIHPNLLRNGAISLLRFSPYIPSNTNTYSSTSSPGLTDFILRNSNFDSNENRQSPRIPIQTLSNVNKLGDIKEDSYQQGFLVSDSNNEKKLIPEDKPSTVNEIWINPSQSNSQNIEMAQASLFPTTGGNSFIVDYDSEWPVANQEDRNPEIRQTVDDVVIHSNNFGQNNNLDINYGNAYMDILRLNGSEADASQIRELEVLEYVPVESLTDNFDASSVIAGTSGLYLQDPVLIFEDYREESNQRLQIPDSNVMTEGSFSSYNNEELPILIIGDSSPVFGDRLQEPLNSVNTENAETSNQFHTFQNNAGTSTSQWMK